MPYRPNIYIKNVKHFIHIFKKKFKLKLYETISYKFSRDYYAYNNFVKKTTAFSLSFSIVIFLLCTSVKFTFSYELYFDLIQSVNHDVFKLLSKIWHNWS